MTSPRSTGSARMLQHCTITRTRFFFSRMVEDCKRKAPPHPNAALWHTIHNTGTTRKTPESEQLLDQFCRPGSNTALAISDLITFPFQFESSRCFSVLIAPFSLLLTFKYISLQEDTVLSLLITLYPCFRSHVFLGFCFKAFCVLCSQFGTHTRFVLFNPFAAFFAIQTA